MRGWEQMCSRCGSCCHSRHIGDQNEFYFDAEESCEHLCEDNRCGIYNKRGQTGFCKKLTLWHILFDPAHPPWCGYRNYLFAKNVEKPSFGD